ncbi:MAG: hypothetical protein AB8H12_13715 [Lewinella sp.]
MRSNDSVGVYPNEPRMQVRVSADIRGEPWETAMPLAAQRPASTETLP